MRVCACEDSVIGGLRERTSDGATGPTAESCGEVDELRIAEGRCQRGDITLHITPTQTRKAVYLKHWQ